MLRIIGFAGGAAAAIALASCARGEVQTFPLPGGSALTQSAGSTRAQSIVENIVPDAANLLQNPSFEQPVVGQGSYETFATGQTFAGWTVVGAPGNVAVVSGTFTQNGFTLDAKSGAQFLDLTGVSQTSTGVSQTVATVPNQKYTLTFFVGNVYDPNGIFGTTSTVNVLVNNVQVFTATNSMHSKKAKSEQVWKKFKTTITASSSNAAIAFMNGDPANDTLNGLDKVSLVAQ